MPYQCFFVKTSAEVFSFIPSADGTPSADTAVRRWRRLYAQGERTQWPPSAAETPCPRRRAKGDRTPNMVSCPLLTPLTFL